MPMSKYVARSRGTPRLRMNAPKVPRNSGAGMKYGGVTATPLRRATK